MTDRKHFPSFHDPGAAPRLRKRRKIAHSRTEARGKANSKKKPDLLPVQPFPYYVTNKDGIVQPPLKKPDKGRKWWADTSSWHINSPTENILKTSVMPLMLFKSILPNKANTVQSFRWICIFFPLHYISGVPWASQVFLGPGAKGKGIILYAVLKGLLPEIERRRGMRERSIFPFPLPFLHMSERCECTLNYLFCLFLYSIMETTNLTPEFPQKNFLEN